MNDLLAEWVSKAEGDYLVAQREMRARGRVSYDAICFHFCVKRRKNIASISAYEDRLT